MFAKSLLSSALVGAVLTSVVSGASIARLDAAPEEKARGRRDAAPEEKARDVVFAPTHPLHDDYLFNSKQNLDLTTEDNFYWSHEDQGTSISSYFPHSVI